jgi:hypothetical protein
MIACKQVSQTAYALHLLIFLQPEDFFKTLTHDDVKLNGRTVDKTRCNRLRT